MAQYIDPFTDTGFKLIFGEKNKESGILKEFLNDLFEGQPDFENIEEIEYLNNERTRKNDSDRTIIYDVYCRTQSGRQFIVEMQRQSQVHFVSRAIYYVSRAIVEQTSFSYDQLYNKWKYELFPVVGVFFCDFHVKGLEDKLVHHIRLCDTETGKPVSDKMCYTFIQLPLFNKSAEECTTEFDKWIFTLKNMPLMENLSFTERDVFNRLATIGNVAALPPAERAAYERDVKWAIDYNSTIHAAQLEGEAKGMAKGMSEGMAKGISQGIAQGIAKGIATVAKNLLKTGLTVEQISAATGLSPQQILELQ